MNWTLDGYNTTHRIIVKSMGTLGGKQERTESNGWGADATLLAGVHKPFGIRVMSSVMPKPTKYSCSFCCCYCTEAPRSGPRAWSWPTANMAPQRRAVLPRIGGFFSLLWLAVWNYGVGTR
jgi:hypothetical protein